MERSLRESISLSQGDYFIFTRPASLVVPIITGITLATSASRALPSAIRKESKEAQVQLGAKRAPGSNLGCRGNNRLLSIAWPTPNEPRIALDIGW